MNRLAWLLVIALAAQDALPAKTLEELKAATVYIKVRAGNNGWVGTGFLVGRDGDNGIVATNAHVIEAGGAAAREVVVVFNSGQRSERRVTAEILSEDPLRDLAVLRVKAKDLPKPIDLVGRQAAKESQGVYILGFPWGDGLSAGDRNPEITVAKGTIKSLRSTKYGELQYVEIDGDVNPGNSGGPMVDASGAIVAVTVAKVVGKNTALGIPADALTSMLAGRPRSIELVEGENTAGSLKITVKVELADPLKKLKSVAFIYVPSAQLKEPPKRGADGAWSAVSTTAIELPLKVDGSGASAVLTLRDTTKQDVLHTYQVKFVRSDGTTHFTEPDEFRAEFSKGFPRTAEAGEWLAKAAGKRPPATTTFPVPAAGTRTVGTAPTKTDDNESVALSLPGDKLAPGGCLSWSSDGQAVVILDRDGMLRRIALAGFKEERVLAIGRPCSSVHRSKEGLVVHVDGLQELWIVDETTLQPKRAIVVGRNHQVACSASASVAFVCGDSVVTVVDLATGRILKELWAEDLREQAMKVKKPADTPATFPFNLRSVLHPVMSGDGKWLAGFCADRLFRMKLGGDPALDEVGYDLRSGMLAMSADGKSIAVGCRLQSAPPDHPRADNKPTYLYRLDNLQKPFAMAPFELECVTFDGPKLVGTFSDRLIVFGADGILERNGRYCEGGTGYGECIAANAGRLAAAGRRGVLVVDYRAAASLPKPTPKDPPPKPVPLPANWKSEGMARFGVVRPDASQVMPGVQWSLDGKSVFMVDRAGTVFKYSASELKEEKQVSVGKGASWMCRSKEGLVILTTGPTELVLLDESLSVKKKIALNDEVRVVSSAALSIAYAMVANAEDLVVVDLRTGKVVKKHPSSGLIAAAKRAKVSDKTSVLTSWSYASVTPDGAYLLCNRDGSLHRFKITGVDLVYEEAGPKAGGEPRHVIDFSSDSKYVAMSSSGVVEGVLDHPPLDVPGIYIYRVDDLGAPLLGLQDGRGPMAFVLDKASETIYTASAGSAYAVKSFNSRGILEHEYALGSGGELPRQMLLNPKDGKLLLVGNRIVVLEVAK